MTTAQGTFPLRTIHLDFHTGPNIPDVGKDFDPTAFAKTFKDAHIDSVTVFAKCHHGMLYYDTDRPERHPGLPRDLDLMGEQIKALHAVGIRAPIYLSVQCDEWAANEHADWIAMNDLTQVKRGDSAFKAGWQILDMSSPYADFLAEQIQEVLDKYAPVDGIFLDMCWDQPSTSKWAKEGMLRSGLNPEDETQRAEYARAVAHTYMERYRDMIEPHLREDTEQGVWFNSRPKTRLHEEKKYVRHIEVESLPTGGWGYAYLPYVARFVRPLGLPTLSHTGRFHKSWGDNGGLKPKAALLYECAQILSQGLTSGVGDLLHPRGVPNKAVYDLIGDVYAHIESCEPFVRGGKLQSEIALVVDPELGDAPGPSGIGAVRALQQLRKQFDIVSPNATLGDYRLVILPETTVVDAALASSLSAYLKSGGSLIISGEAAVGPDGKPVLAELGIETHGDSPFSHTFLAPKGVLATVTEPYNSVMYERTIRMTPTAGSEVLAGVLEPYFERTWDHFSGHDYTVADKESPYASIIKSGNVITFGAPFLRAFAKHGNGAYRDLIGGSIDLLLPEPLITDDGPRHLEATIVKTDDATVVHLLSFIPARLVENFDIVNDAIPVADLHLRVKSDVKPTSVTLQPQGRTLDFDFVDGYVQTSVSFTEGHGMVVIK